MLSTQTKTVLFKLKRQQQKVGTSYYSSRL